MSQRLKKLLARGILFSLITLMCETGAILAYGFHNDLVPSDVAIVLGSKVETDGNPSPRLRARLDETLDLYQRGMFHDVIVSGGTGVEGFSEAKIMKDYLMNHNIPEASILIDEHGSDTWATGVNGARLMKDHGWASAMVVTQYFHIARSVFALKENGVTTIHHAHPSFFELRDIYSTLREAVAYIAYVPRSF